ncbi:MULTISPECIES: FtsK/SpoIIIE domain-containing protein [unclassified Blastococcus]
MKLKLTLLRPGGDAADLVVTVEPTAPLRSVAEALAERDPRGAGVSYAGQVGLRLHGDDGRTTLPPPDATVTDVALRSGSRVSLAPITEFREAGRGAPVATLRVVDGPDAGREFPLPQGTSLIGRARSSDVRLSDPLVSKEHARLNVGDTVEIVDLRSANGILVGGGQVERAVLGRDDVAVLGETTIAVVQHRAAGEGQGAGPTLDFNRSPRLTERYTGRTFDVPEAPTPPRPSRLPVLSLIAPLVLGAVIYAVTRSVYSLLFVAFSPILGVGTYLEGRIGNKRTHRRAREAWRAQLAELTAEVDAEHGREAAVRRAENPSVAEVGTAAVRQTTLLWSRRREMPEFLQVRLGLGRQASRSSVADDRQRGVELDLQRDREQLVAHAAEVDGVPVVADLRGVGAVGVGGHGETAAAVARGLLVQLVGLHSPADLVVVGVAAAGTARRWEWLKWLPHTNSPYSPLPGGHLETSPSGCAELVGALDDLVERRRGTRPADGEDPAMPRIVVVVENDAPVSRARLVQLAERGGPAGVHVLWVAPSVERLPAACRVFVDVPPQGPAAAGLPDAGELVTPLEVEPVSAEQAELLGRRLAPVVDVGALVDDASDLPVSVTTLSLTGPALGASAAAVAERWTETDSLPVREGDPVVPRRAQLTLRAVVGQSAGSAMHLDLRTQGPHALVGGTTGSGKSEFLQTWVLTMAAAYSPARVTFLFVDYKGGSAFKDCVDLPHSVGMVTDLSPHLVRRALTSLNAELRHREELLNRHGYKDLAAMEKAGVPGCPPSLVIVVDEFAALVHEVPEFVDGVVNVAQRGRSLGLHLILATQRPAGVIKDNLRANTNLRVALRMADEADSVDVLGTPVAAGFDPELPGRAVAKTGPGRLTVFQSSYSGGTTPDEAPPPEVQVDELAFGPSARWERPLVEEAGEEGPADMTRMVATITAATRHLEIPAPRRPWLPALAEVYDLARMPRADMRVDSRVVLGVGDVPERQVQPPVAFEPDRDGNMAVFGTGGTGKSALLRTVAVSAGLTVRGGACQVYALDFAGGALTMLEELPHVGAVVLGDDGERVLRLLRTLRALIDDRAPRWAAVRAGSLGDYRRLAERPDEPRIVLLVDGLAAFRQEYEFSRRNKTWDLFTGIAAEGRQFGVHVVVSADRPATMSSALGSAIQRRLVLRLADDNDYALLGVPTDVLGATSPPGRGMLDGQECQIAVLGGSRSVADQAAAVSRFAAALRDAGVQEAPEVGRLPSRVPLSALPVAVDDLPTIGVDDEELTPLGVDPRGAFMISGPSGSGRTTALVTLALSVARWRPEARLVYLGNPRSALLTAVPWAATATDAEAVAAQAKDVLARIEDDRAPFHLVVVERIADLNGTPAEAQVAALVNALRTRGHGVVGDGETGQLTGFQAPIQALRAERRGFALQPDANDGSVLWQAPFGAPVRAEFPPGRGFLVVRGTVRRVQLAVPE